MYQPSCCFSLRHCTSPNFLSYICPPLSYLFFIPFLFLCRLSDFSKLCRFTFPFSLRPLVRLKSLPMCASALLFQQIWSPPLYATAQILHGLPLVTPGTLHLSARTKLKCNSHFTIIVIVIMRHSLNFFLKAAFIFLFLLCSFANQSLPYFVLFSFFTFYFLTLFCCVCYWNSRRTLDQSRVSDAPVSVLCWCVWSFLLLLSWLENIWALLLHHHLQWSLQH